MTDAQSWTLIAGFLAILATMIGMTLRVVRVEIARLDTKIDGVDARTSARIDGVDARLTARIDALEERLGGKIDQLDRDVQTVINRLMGP